MFAVSWWEARSLLFRHQELVVSHSCFEVLVFVTKPPRVHSDQRSKLKADWNCSSSFRTSGTWFHHQWCTDECSVFRIRRNVSEHALCQKFENGFRAPVRAFHHFMSKTLARETAYLAGAHVFRVPLCLATSGRTSYPVRMTGANAWTFSGSGKRVLVQRLCVFLSSWMFYFGQPKKKKITGEVLPSRHRSEHTHEHAS